MISRPDPIKARIALHYLAKATKKLHEREESRKKLAAQLKQLKKISTNTLQKHLTELEKRINETVRIENKILKSQSQEDYFHEELKNKINVLEGKLGKYMDTKEAREKRIKELEEKMEEKQQPKHEISLDIKESIQKMEKIYEEAKKSGKYSKKDLDRIKKRINTLKNKLK
jgi:chromosome segregation ATPase